jgi:threonine synthase
VAGSPERDFLIRCVDCAEVLPGFGYECARCGGVVVVEPEQLTAAPAVAGHAATWRREQLLPVSQHSVSLGEGSTPLLELGRRVTGVVPVPVWGKLESQNPTLSFKDRAMALGVSHARGLGMKGLVVASTGNAAVSASAYAAAAGLECRVLVGSESDAGRKLDASRAFGADVEEIPGDYSAAYAAARALEGQGWMNVSTTYRNPLLAEGYRPIAFELIDQLNATPDSVIVPVGAGPLLRGIEGGFRDALTVGYASHMPRLIAVQASAVAPLAHAWASSDWIGALSAPRPTAPTVATAIADALRGYERQGLLTLEAVRRTGGCVIGLPEGRIIAARNRLLQAGVWVEPSAATAVAVLEVLGDEWWGESTGPVVSMLTGHGIKAPVPSV